MAKYPKGIRKVLDPSKVKAKGIKTNDPNAFLLGSLLKASPQFISGNYLAEKLKMSRVGIWSRIDKLRKTGLLIEACQNRGYRLAGEPNILVRPLLEAWFKECKLEYPFHLLDRVDSTNSEAERLLASGHKAPFIVLSHQQEMDEAEWEESGTAQREGIFIYPSHYNPMSNWLNSVISLSGRVFPLGNFFKNILELKISR
jgi:biotin operon repressor BirA-like protein